MPFWVDVAARLEREDGYEVCYWLGGMRIQDNVRGRFPNAVFHVGHDARDGRPPPGLEVSPAPLDEELLRAMTPCETVVLKMMERFDLCDYFSYGERVRQYHRILSCMAAMFDHVRPHLVIHATSPHVVHDYVFYALCRLHGVATVMFERTSLPDRIFHLARLEDGCEPLQEAYAAARRAYGGEAVRLADDVEDSLARMTGPYDRAVPVRLRYKLDRAVKKIPLGETVGPVGHLKSRLAAACRGARIVAETLLKGPPEVFGKRKGKPFGERHMGRLEFLSYRIDVRRKRRRLMACYEALCHPVDFGRPYVYVALQCQPERQASPNGGVFAHQNLMVDLLSKSVPAGWHLYVKEHVSQFNDYQTPERGRSELFYRDMAALPNVSLVPMSVNSFALIDKARAVATVAGTAGWEAVVRGRPALLFAYGWYRGCEGVFFTPTAEACRQALAEIEAGYAPDPALVRLFVQVAGEVFGKRLLRSGHGRGHGDRAGRQRRRRLRGDP